MLATGASTIYTPPYSPARFKRPGEGPGGFPPGSPRFPNLGRRSNISTPFKRDPFSGQIHSAGTLLHVS